MGSGDMRHVSPHATLQGDKKCVKKLSMESLSKDRFRKVSSLFPQYDIMTEALGQLG